MISLGIYDTMVLSMGSLFLGIVMLIKGGNWAIDSAVYIANKFGLSPMLVGFTIIAFGTSLPELIVSVLANLQDSPGIAIGNVLGSNIANILLVLGVSALFAPIIAPVKGPLLRDLIFMMLATCVLAGLMSYGAISSLVGFGMVVLLLAYVFLQYKLLPPSEYEQDMDEVQEYATPWMAYGILFLGLMSIAVGAEFLVKGAKTSASVLGVPDAVIALSLVALGTSLPELSTSIIAVRKGQAGMLVGNIVGSNVFNILMILGVTSAVKEIGVGSFPEQLANFDVWVTFSISLLLCAVLAVFGKINRVIGGLFFAAYIGYNIYIYAANMIGS